MKQNQSQRTDEKMLSSQGDATMQTEEQKQDEVMESQKTLDQDQIDSTYKLPEQEKPKLEASELDEYQRHQLLKNVEELCEKIVFSESS